MNSCDVRILEPAPRLPGVMDMYAVKGRDGEASTKGQRRQILDFYEGVNAVHRQYVGRMSQAWQAYLRSMSSLAGMAGSTETCPRAGQGEADFIDPEREAWLWDHCPTHTLPAYPFMFMLDKIARELQGKYPGQVIGAMRDVKVHRWLVCAQRQRIRTELGAPVNNRIRATLFWWREAAKPVFCRFEPLMTAEVEIRDQYRRPRSPVIPGLKRPRPVEDPYGQELCFHGPRLRVVRRLFYGDNGSSAEISADPGPVPGGILNPRLLDGLMQAIPYDELSLWTDAAMEKSFSYPRQIPYMEFYAPVPRTGAVRCEVRFAGFRDENTRFPQFDIYMLEGERCILTLKLEGICFPQGMLGGLSRKDRKRFLLREAYVEGAGLCRQGEEGFFLPMERVKGQNWFPGTLEQVYGLAGELTEKDKTRCIAAKEYVADQLKKHPAGISLEEGGRCARHPEFPLRRYRLFSQERDGGILVKGTGAGLDISVARLYWRERLHLNEWVMEDLFAGLTRQFVSDYRVEDAAAYALALKAGPVLYLANHQTTVEGHLFIYLTSALARRPVGIIAKKEHQRGTWIGGLLGRMGRYPGLGGGFIDVFYFDRQNQSSMLGLMKDIRHKMLAEGLSLLVHLEGTRALQCRKPVAKISSVFIDLALELRLPIVPVRFAGGLPVEPLAQRIDFPHGYGAQSVHLGKPLWPGELLPLPYAERKERVRGALQATGGSLESETPHPGNALFKERVERLMGEAALDEPRAVLLQVLRDLEGKSAETLRVVNSHGSGPTGQGDPARERWLEELSAWLHGKGTAAGGEARR